MTPITILVQSTFLGYMCFSVIFTLLGFRMVFFGLGIGLGWDNENACENSVKSTFVIIATFIIVGSNYEVEYYLKPFASAICVLGSNIHLLGLLIISSKYYRRHGN